MGDCHRIEDSDSVLRLSPRDGRFDATTGTSGRRASRICFVHGAHAATTNAVLTAAGYKFPPSDPVAENLLRLVLTMLRAVPKFAAV